MISSLRISLPLMACMFLAVPKNEDYLIHSKGIGAIQLGMTLREAKKAQPNWHFSNAMDDEDVPCIEIRIDKKMSVQLFLDGEKGHEPQIVTIVVFDPHFSTADGIAPGCTFSKIQNTWGEFQDACRSDARAVQYVYFLHQPKWLTLGIRGSVIQNPNQQCTKIYYPNAKIGHMIINYTIKE